MKKSLVLVAAFALLPAIGFQQSALAAGNNGAGANAGKASSGADAAATSTKASRVTAAAPTDATDPTKVPHYFGPYPNWANSPFTQSTAAVTFVDPGGSGVGAEAVAQIDPTTGGIKTIDVTVPGHDYSQATTVDIAGGTGATATPSITASGAVVSLKVSASGSAYESFAVTLTGGGGTGAAVSAVGGVDAVTISNGGTGYTMPTVDFDLPGDPSGTQAAGHVPMIANGDTVNGMTSAGVITQVVVDSAGTGYTVAPGVAIHDGTLADPILGATLATATSTLKLTGLTVDSIGSGYTSSPTVDVTDPTGSGTGATATAVTDTGAMSAVTVTTAGSGFLTAGLKKFQDELPITCDPKVDGTGCPLAAATPGMGPANKYIPLGVPEVKTYAGKEADQYVIGLVQYRTKFSSDLPATVARGYVQISTAAVPGQHVQLTNELMDGTKVDIPGYFGVTAPQWLGPIVSATKDRPVRVVFRNLLPTGAGGDLFLPTDTSMMGAGTGPVAKADPTNGSSVLDGVRNPACTDAAKGTSGCFTDNRATLHLHGGTTPWISDGTPHQWVTPAGENTDWPEGVSVQNVPDMTTDGTATGPAVCAAKDDGCSTFFYSNQQSARMMWYHDHSWGITRLNVYAGEVGGYLLTDDTEKALISTNTIPGAVDTLPLIVQDRTFTPDAVQLAAQDPTWDSNKWGTKGSFWYHHVYMPAQNPGDPSGMSSYGRWMYGPWFWPPASDIKYGPIANPYYDPTCNLDVPSTWTYQVGPFCEPEQIPGTPNISTGMEQFNDTPLVNGVAYPKLTLDPKTYRMRLLNGANDRFFNFQWYTADPLQGAGDSEVALKPNELLAAQTDPVVSPTPVDANNSAAGPDWIEIGTEGGFLPAPAVVDGQQPTTYITDGTRFDVGNVDKHSMLLAPAERADVLVDFSRFAGKTLILYNDAPAAFPARVASYDYYTGAPDMSPIGAPSVLPGFGPNTRTIMQVKIADTAPATAFNLTKLRTAFQHHADGSGVFESSQHPIIVGQAAYNSAYGTSFAGSSNCNSGTLTKCDGLARVNDTATFGFNTLKGPNAKMTAKVEPKAIHDEMNSTTFDEYGRMQATLGIEAQPPTPGGQNVTLYPYVNPATEIIDATNLPSADTKVTAISSAADGSQIWRITHNGVDTHPIHFHLFDVQLINRVTWDNIIIPTEPSELGWKETVRVSPLEDTIVALRPVIPKVPFEVPNSVRPLNPMMPLGSTAMFNNVLPDGTPSSSITNQLVNFGWEYVYHCHILSHEEMDMMRPISVAIPPLKADGLVRTVANKRNQITFNDNSITETSFALERTSNGTTWATVGTLASPLSAPNTHGSRMIVDSSGSTSASYLYRVVALNAVGYQTEFPSTTVKSTSGTVAVNVTPTLAPTALTASVLAGPQVSLTWKDNASNETGFVVERSANGGATYTQVATPAAKAGSGSSVTLTDATVALGTTYLYRVAGTGLGGTSAFSNVVTILVAVPAIPTQLLGTAARQGSSERITTSWADVNNETSYRVQWSTSSTFATIGGTGTTAANVITLTTPNLARTIWFVRVQAVNPLGSSAFSTPVQVAAAL